MADSFSGVCNACQTAFDTSDEQRDHYRSDWHRYNLTRKASQLPSMPLDMYLSRLEAEKNSVEEAEKSARGRRKNEKDAVSSAGRGSRKTYQCDECLRTFSSETALKQHILSEKHVDEESEERKQPYLDGDVEVDTAACFFCRTMFDDTETNIDHMRKVHGFFIPYVEFLTDLDGLLAHVGVKIFVANRCLYCHKRFQSQEATQDHMISKQHSKMDLDTYDMEFAKYYSDEIDVEGDDVEMSQERGLSTRMADNFDAEEALDSSVGVMTIVSGDGSKKTIVDRHLAYAAKQNVKPMENRLCVLSNIQENYRRWGVEVGSVRPKMLNFTKDDMKAIRFEQKMRMQVGVKSNKLFVARKQVLYAG